MLSTKQYIVDTIDVGNINELLRLEKNSELFIIFHSKNKILENFILFFLAKKNIRCSFENLYLDKMYQDTSRKADTLTKNYLKKYSTKNINNEYFYMRIANFYYEKVFRYCSILNFINSNKKISKQAKLYLARCKIVNKKIIKHENREIILYKQFNTLNDSEYRWTYNSKEKNLYLNLLRYSFHIIKNIFWNSPFSSITKLNVDLMMLTHFSKKRDSVTYQKNIHLNNFQCIFINNKLELFINNKKYKINYLHPKLYGPLISHIINYKKIYYKTLDLEITDKMRLFNDWINSFFLLNLLKNLNVKVFYSNFETPFSNLLQQVCKQTNTVSLCYSFSAGYFPIQNCFSHQRKNADIFFVWSNYFSDLFKASGDLSFFHTVVGSPIDNFNKIHKKITKKRKPIIAFCDNTTANDLNLNKVNLIQFVYKLARFCSDQNFDLLIKVKKDINIYNNIITDFSEIIELDTNQNQIDIIMKADVIVAFSISTLPIILSNLNKKIILLEFDDTWIQKYNFFKKIVTDTDQKLFDIIQKNIKNDCMKKVEKLNNLHSFYNGKSSKRIFNYIEYIVNSSYFDKKEKILDANKKFSKKYNNSCIVLNHEYRY